MSGFSYIIIFIGACLLAFGIIEMLFSRKTKFSNFDDLPLIYPLLVAKLSNEEDFFTRKGHTLIGHA